MNTNNENYQLLAVAICKQAALDYLKAKRYIVQHPEPRTEAEEVKVWYHNKTLAECLAYFHSSLYSLSMETPAEKLITMLDEEAASGRQIRWNLEL